LGIQRFFPLLLISDLRLPIPDRRPGSVFSDCFSVPGLIISITGNWQVHQNTKKHIT
jgi:hypothetical protein